MNASGASSSSHPPPAPAAAQSSLLAPGFRFHPTDEELVSYYLKRRVSGRPIRVEAIAEVDLYKAEPWDLPAMSRLRSRDMEWYFFSPLDRKYANRSRTNRATAQGYWKTTGKDRPVRHGPRTVGMKKTLVFHAGRAPRGERTNWVMHEYRLEDEELTRAGIPQDAYVVCRIFQKSGTGPQNGAQYGAPFVEEEWEEADGMPLAVVDGHDSGHDSGDGADVNDLPRAAIRMGNPVVVGAGDVGFLQAADFENNQNEGGIQHENADLVASSSDGQISNSHSEDPIFLVEEIFQGQSSIGNIRATEIEDGQFFRNDIERDVFFADQPQSPLIDYNGFLVLDDIVDAVSVEYPSSEDSVSCILSASNGQMSVNMDDEVNSSPEILGTHEVPQMQPMQEDFFVELNDLLNPMANYRSLEDNEIFYDASADPEFVQDNVVQMQGPYSPIGDSDELNMMDDTLAYFDCMDNSLHNSTLGSSENLCLASSNESTAEVDGNGVPTDSTHVQASVANIGASSMVELPHADNLSNNMNVTVTEEPDNQGNDNQGNDGSNKTLPKRLANMLGSFSAPPAFASESPASPGKCFGSSSRASSASSIQAAAGVIQIHGFNMMSRAENWTLDKNGDMGFLLSVGVARNVLGKSEGSEPMAKMQGWVMSVVLRGGFCLFLFSALFMALSVKAVMRACSW